MTMEEMWNMRPPSNKPSTHPSVYTPNQFNLGSGQLPQPYMAKEVCVIERTFRQEPMLPNVMSFGSQGLTANKTKSELLAMVSGSQQHSLRPNNPSSMIGRSSHIASHPSFTHMNLADYGGYDGWSTQNLSIPSQTTRLDGSAKFTTVTDPSIGHSRDFNLMIGGRVNESSFLNGSRAPGAEFSSQNSSFSRGAHELDLEGSRRLFSSPWLAEPLRQRHRHPNVQASTMFMGNGDLHKVDSMSFNMGPGLRSQPHSNSGPTPSGGLRVYCINYSEAPVGGLLSLTDAGQLGVTCACHGQHMSVAKFTQHSGLNVPNPGLAVFIEGGENLVQWRRSFFSQFGVKVPDDNVGWEWLNSGSAETGYGKYKDAGPGEIGRGRGKGMPTQRWQKEENASCGGTSPMMKSRRTQMWDACIENGSTSTPHATNSISNTKYGLVNSGNGSVMDSREAGLRNSGPSYRGMSVPADVGSGQLYTASPLESLSRGQGNMGGITFQSMSNAGHEAISNERNVSNDEGHRYSSAEQQMSCSVRNGKGVNYLFNRCTDGQEFRTRENDNTSNFELRLGQPSQQTQAAGTSFSSMATSSVGHPKPPLFEQIMNKVWDGKSPLNLQQLNPTNLPNFFGISDEKKEQLSDNTARQSDPVRTDGLDRFGEEKRGGNRGAAYHNSSQSTRQMFYSSQGVYELSAVSEQVQEKFTALNSIHQPSTLSRSGDSQFRSTQSGSDKLAAKFISHPTQSRSVTLGNGTSLDSLSTGTLMQLGNKTGQRILETAIQSSFSYRATGPEGLRAQLKNSPSRVDAVESLSSDVDMFDRPSLAPRARLPDLLVRNQGHRDLDICSRGIVDGVSHSRLEQDAKRGFQMREQGTTFLSQRPVQRDVQERCSTRCDEVRRSPGSEHLSEGKKSILNSIEQKQWHSQHDHALGDNKQDWTQGGPQALNAIDSGLVLKVQNAEILKHFRPGDGERRRNEAEYVDVQLEPLADPTVKEVKDGVAPGESPQSNFEILSVNGEDTQCTCFKCRKASPSTRGQAVPRLAGQVCLKEMNSLASTVETGKRVGYVEGEHDALVGRAKVQQPETEPHLDTGTVKDRDCTQESSGPTLPWEPRQREIENEQQEVIAKREEAAPGYNGELSDDAAKGTAAGRSSSVRSAGGGGVCSNSSENVSSGLSDERCAASDKGCPSVVQESDITPTPGAVDEGSGIGKCSSSDDMDIGMATNQNELSLLEYPAKLASPSSMGCPSSSNVGRRLVVRRSGVRGTGGCHGTKEVESNDMEAEPVMSTGKLERSQRRNMKWKWMELGEDGGDAKNVSPTSSSGNDAKFQLPLGNARMGFQAQDTLVRADADLSTKDLKASTGEVMLPSKRRKLAIPRRHQEAKSTNVTEDNLESASLGENTKINAGSLVIRVPVAGVNRHKVNKGIRTKLQSKCGGNDWRHNPAEGSFSDMRNDKIGSDTGESAVSKLGTMGKVSAVCDSGLGDAGTGDPVKVPTFLTKSLRSPRTPSARPSPRNGKMVSLSVILKHAKDSSPISRGLEGKPIVQKLKEAVPEFRKDETIPKRLDVHSVAGNVGANRGREVKDRDHFGIGGSWKTSKSTTEATIQKKSEAQVAPGHITACLVKDGKDPNCPYTGVVWKEGRKMIQLHKEDAQNRKVRSLLELTGKNNMNGSRAEVSEFAEGENSAAVWKAGKQASAMLQMDELAVRSGSVGIGGPIPRGERSVRPGVSNRRKVEWHRSIDAQVEADRCESVVEKEKSASKPGDPFECAISQLGSASDSIISETKHRQGFGEHLCLVRKQIRSSNVKRGKIKGNESLDKDTRSSDKRLRMRDPDLMPHEERRVQKGGITGLGVLKRKGGPELVSVPGTSTKRSKYISGLNKAKESLVCDVEASIGSVALLKRGELPLDNRKLKDHVDHHLGSNLKVHMKAKPTFSKEVTGPHLKKERSVASFEIKKANIHERNKCDVCGAFTSVSYNKLLCCSRCPVKVHQACYGVPKIPKGPWSCRTCKFKIKNSICVLCGYGGGAMTRVHKARSFCHGLLQVWRDMKDENMSDSSLADDEETPLSETNTTQLCRNRSVSVSLGRCLKSDDSKVTECESCACEEPRDNSSICKVCRKDSPEPGSSGGNIVKYADRALFASSGRESWRRNNTVRSVLKDSAAKQWAHMVCTLWMPGTRCLNMGTMGVFDVSGVKVSLRKMLCSICRRKGGACIQCRVPKCSTPFHVLCAHEKGLLQSETVMDGSNQVGFFGKCQNHGDYCVNELDGDTKLGLRPVRREVCARTEGYKGKLSLEERAKAQQRMTLEGAMAVTPEQVAAALRVDVRKMTTRRFLKPANSAMKCDHREYLRFKQKKGWKKLGVYKSGIHALGLYTTDFIAEGEVVVEYVGEIVGSRVADKREAEYHSGKRLQYQGACYLFRIDTEQIIDATRKGGIARFVNHSCSPNCVAKVICVENLKKVVFFAKRDIYAGEEVTYDYKFNCDEVGDKIPCFCGTPECRGTLN